MALPSRCQLPVEAEHVLNLLALKDLVDEAVDSINPNMLSDSKGRGGEIARALSSCQRKRVKICRQEILQKKEVRKEGRKKSPKGGLSSAPKIRVGPSHLLPVKKGKSKAQKKNSKEAEGQCEPRFITVKHVCSPLVFFEKSGTPFFALRQIDTQVLRDKLNIPGMTEQLARARITQFMLKHHIKPTPGTKPEIRVLKNMQILGKRAPKCSLLSLESLTTLLRAFSPELLDLARDLELAWAQQKKSKDVDAAVSIFMEEDSNDMKNNIASSHATPIVPAPAGSLVYSDQSTVPGSLKRKASEPLAALLYVSKRCKVSDSEEELSDASTNVQQSPPAAPAINVHRAEGQSDRSAFPLSPAVVGKAKTTSVGMSGDTEQMAGTQPPAVNSSLSIAPPSPISVFPLPSPSLRVKAYDELTPPQYNPSTPRLGADLDWFSLGTGLSSPSARFLCSSPALFSHSPMSRPLYSSRYSLPSPSIGQILLEDPMKQQFGAVDSY